MNMHPKDFEKWVIAVRPSLLRQAESILGDAVEAEDTVQDAMLRIWQLRTEWYRYRSLDAVAVTAVRHLALSALRHRRFVQTDLAAADYPVEALAESRLIEQEDARRLAEAIEALPSRQQAVLRLRHLEGMETTDIARLIGASEESIRMNLSRARHSIMRRFGL